MTDRKKIREKTGYTRQNQQDNADSWYTRSVSFHEASIILYEHKERLSGGIKLFQFNAALSLELIFKAILAAKKEKIKQTHVLRDLCTNAEVELDDDQKSTLGLLTENFLWVGRYPAPTSEAQWDNFHNNIIEEHIERSQSGNTFSMNRNQKRFPSMENYKRIWKICLAKYESVIL
ncbi:MAG: HEPN domain-containing protein [Deltaproteobacteria bacterium]|nr:HEPN domain-containing protein [Deltaproteobacteria bacterium]